MKNTLLKPLSLLGLSLMMTLSVAAQDAPKVKINDNEVKYKSEDVKMKDNGREVKYKSDDLKIKGNGSETKIKGKVSPNRPSSMQQTEMKTGSTDVRTKEQVTPMTTVTVESASPAPTEIAPVTVPKTATAVKTTTARHYAANKSATHKPVATRRTTGPKVIVRTKVVRDTVLVPSPPQTIVATKTEYVRDTVLVTRVDTVVKTETKDTYSGYRVPAGDFKKVKLKKDKDGEVHMKRKE